MSSWHRTAIAPVLLLALKFLEAALKAVAVRKYALEGLRLFVLVVAQPSFVTKSNQEKLLEVRDAQDSHWVLLRRNF